MPGLLLLGRLTAAVWVMAALLGCAKVDVHLRPAVEPLEERTISGSGPAKVVLIDLSGALFQRRSAGLLEPAEDLLSRLAEELAAAGRDPAVKALLLKIDSPGGSVTVSDLILHQIVEFKQRHKVKVVVSMMEVAASGGYYVALAGDKIYALPTTLTGSIGVLALRLDLSGLLTKIGVEAEAVTSGRLKDMWSIFRPATEEERRIMQSLIDGYFSRFRQVLKLGRPGISEEQLAQAATGRIFSAREALALNLIDAIGYPEEAFTGAKKLAGLEEARLVVYQRPRAHRPNLYSRARAGAAFSSSLPELGLEAGPQFMYLWLPGLR